MPSSLVYEYAQRILVIVEYTYCKVKFFVTSYTCLDFKFLVRARKSMLINHKKYDQVPVYNNYIVYSIYMHCLYCVFLKYNIY